MVFMSDNNNSVSTDKIIENGKELPFPNFKITNLTIVNNKIFLNGREFKKGKWVITLRGIWNVLF